MKRVISIMLLAIFLSSNTAIGQILRLPTLIHHYLEHVEWDNYSLLEFLGEHYGKPISHPDDKHGDHQNLPFKGTQSYNAHIVIQTPEPNYQLPENHTEPYDFKRPLKNQVHYSHSYLKSIWKPPRIIYSE